MYRSYEDPHRLEKLLEEIENEILHTTDEDRLIDLYIEREEMRDRIRFAWDDDEFESEY